MKELDDERNLLLLRRIVAGEHVRVNVSRLAEDLGIHRATVRSKVASLYRGGMLSPPAYPFLRIFEEYPLMVLAWADIPRRAVEDLYRDDSHVFAAFSCMSGAHNTLLMEFFEDMESYQLWRENLVTDHKLPPRGDRAPASVGLFSNRLSFKYDPNCYMEELSDDFESKGTIALGGRAVDALSFAILRKLLRGECIRTVDTELAQILGTHRRTVSRRIETLLERGIVGFPRCFFPRLLVPPGYHLVVSFVEVRKSREEIMDLIGRDPHVPRALRISSGRYNLLVMSGWRAMEGFFDWREMLDRTFPGAVGAMENTILSSRTIHRIEQQRVSLGWIERRLRAVHERRVGTLFALP